MATIYQDETQFVDDPQILEAIEQLKRKMDAVSGQKNVNGSDIQPF